jgi:hypothetical protein
MVSNKIMVGLYYLFAVLVFANSCRPASVFTAVPSGFKEIFDSKTLNGWEGDSTYWRVENGAITGETTKATLLQKSNSFLIWQGGEPENFELKVLYKISPQGNSGINYRSEKIVGEFALKGYQADLDGEQRYSGSNYEERGRTTLAARAETVVLHPLNEIKNEPLENYIKSNVWTHKGIMQLPGNADSLKSFIKNDGWNEYHIIVNGNRLQHYINGILMSDVTDKDTANRKMKGFIGIQVHVGPPMMVQYKNIWLKILERPANK